MYLKSLTTFAALALASFNVSAQNGIELGSDKYILSGFASISAAKSDNVTPWYVHREIADDWCFDCDAIFGLQLDAYFTDRFRGSIQVVKRPEDEFDSPELEWAYLAYAFDMTETRFDSAEIEARLGKLRLPLLLNSSYYFVGNAYPWMRPVSEVYNRLLGITSMEGIELYSTWMLSDTLTLSIEPYYGLSKSERVDRMDQIYNFDFNYFGGVSVGLEGENYKIHSAYGQSTATLLLELDIGGVLMIQDLPEDTYKVTTLSGIYNFANGIDLWGEFIDDRQALSYYIGVVYNRNKWVPYTTFATSYDGTGSDSDTYTLGVRYNIKPNLSVNIELSHSKATYPFDPTDLSPPRGQFVLSPWQLQWNAPGTLPPFSWTQVDDTDAMIVTLGLNYNF